MQNLCMKFVTIKIGTVTAYVCNISTNFLLKRSYGTFSKHVNDTSIINGYIYINNAKLMMLVIGMVNA
ncbi:MAG: hypothetical protein LBD17_02190 [Endomicrobium sp.]|nr:hypothetical protein [Endomicrobium sp.]